MKIAMIGQKGIPVKFGGVERHVEELSLRLAEMNNDVFVYTRSHYTDKNLKKYQGVNLISVPSIYTKNLDAISHTFFSTIHALFQDYDVIHYHGVGPALLAFIPRIFKPSTRVVVTFHCIDRHHQKWGKFARLMLWLGERAACKFAHKVITVSQNLRDYCYESYNAQTEYIPNGVPQAISEKPSIITNKYGLLGNDYLLVVARLIPHKGIHHLIAAYKKLATNKKLVIVGDGYFTDDYVKVLKQMAVNNKQIIFTGFQSGRELAELYSNAYAYVQPSESEGLPISILEAASYGKCVLASDIPANLEIVRECGLHFQNRNVNDLANKLFYLIANAVEVEKTGKYARKFVLQNYNWEDITEKINNLYLDLTSDKKVSFCHKTSEI